MERTIVRKGLGNWAAMKDNAMAGGLDASIDLASTETFNGTEQSGTIEFLAHRLRLNPRAEEAGVIAKLETQIVAFVEKNYGDIDSIVLAFFDRIGASDRPEASDLEGTILAIQKVIYVSTATVSKLYQDAYLADRVQQDEYWAAFKELQKTPDLTKITIGDRQAYAYEKSRDSRFYYYYIYLLWRRLDEKLDSLRNLQRTLEFQRNRAVKDKGWS